MRGASLALLAIGMAAGFAGGWWVRGAPAQAPPTEHEGRADPTAEPPAALPPTLEGKKPAPPPAAPAPAPSPHAPAASAPTGASSEGAKPPALLDADPAFLEARIREIAEGIRRDAEQQARNAETTARSLVAQQIARERSVLADPERGEPFELLRKLGQDREAPFEMLSSSAGLERFFRVKSRAGTVDGTQLAPPSVLKDGERIVFPRGRHDLKVQSLYGRGSIPNDLVLEGQSMDETLLVLTSDLGSQTNVHNLTLRDLTLDCGDNYLTDFRGVGITLRLERCRVIGFDMGAGGSVMLSAESGVFHATDSRIEGGFGRAPGFGNLFRVRKGFLARLEGCTLVGPFRSVTDDGAYTFDRCVFEGIARDGVERRGHVRLVDCRFQEGPGEAKAVQRQWKELNPAWDGARR